MSSAGPRCPGQSKMCESSIVVTLTPSVLMAVGKFVMLVRVNVCVPDKILKHCLFVAPRSTKSEKMQSVQLLMPWRFRANLMTPGRTTRTRSACTVPVENMTASCTEASQSSMLTSTSLTVPALRRCKNPHRRALQPCTVTPLSSTWEPSPATLSAPPFAFGASQLRIAPPRMMNLLSSMPIAPPPSLSPVIWQSATITSRSKAPAPKTSMAPEHELLLHPVMVPRIISRKPLVGRG